MTLDQAIKIQSTIDGKVIAIDTVEFLDQTYYSKTKEQWIRYGDMHLDHFFRVFQNELEYKEDVINESNHISKSDIKSLIKEVMEEND
jgi:hypothetical protein